MENKHHQLTFARECRGYTQTQLASSIKGLSQSNLSKFEKGFNTLSDELLYRILDHLDFPINFLEQRINNNSESEHYRKKTGITQTIKRNIDCNYRLIGLIVDKMSDELEWPEIDNLEPLDIEEGYTPEYIAKHNRQRLGLKPNEPVRDICALLESNGIIVAELDTTDKFDGVSLITDKSYPLIVINKRFSNDRKRFTIAHELGHLLMHSINNPAIPKSRDNKEKENEANRFASEFLMPSKIIEKSLRNLVLRDLAELKRYWLTSMASIMRKARDLECISDQKYKYMNIEFSRMGLRRKEDINVYIDNPVLLKKGYAMYKNELGYSDKEISRAFALPIDKINELLLLDNRKLLRLV